MSPDTKSPAGSLSSQPYRGRFAPSPTGPLHFGSLVAAVGSYLDARAHGGEWLVRMEDVDKPREVPGAADGILRTLERFGFEWSGPVMVQSRRTDAYETALRTLRERGLTFACGCSRKEAGEVYPGTCRDGLPAGRSGRAWRAKVGQEAIRFCDRLQGHFEQDLARDVGDFVLLRADGLFAYQLAAVVDDAAQGVTDIVRGADLLDSTPRQIWLQRALNLPTPSYLHLPVAVDANGQKLSKQTLAPAVDELPVSSALVAALDFLGQALPQELCKASVEEIWQWSCAHWDVSRIPRQISARPKP